MSRQWVPKRADVPGIALATVLGAITIALCETLPPSPVVSDILIALALGVLVLNTPLRTIFGLALPSAEREPDRYAAGLRFTGKWLLRLAIILMGLKVQTKFFGVGALALVGGTLLVTLPSAFFVAHAIGAALGVRRPMADLLAAGTMICGASAVNATAPVAGARREEQGVAIGVVFLFSMVALVAFRPIAAALHLDSSFAGIWSGLAVNDLSSAIAVGKQMGGAGGEMATAAKSARVLLLGPFLIALAMLRRDTAPRDAKLRATIVEQLPSYVLGYLALAGVRAICDRTIGDTKAWAMVLSADRLLVDLLLVTVVAAVGLHLELKKLLSAGWRALVVGGGASCWTAGLSLAIVTATARGAASTATTIALVAFAVAFVAHRIAARAEVQDRQLLARFRSGAPMSLAEAMKLLDALERNATLDEATLRTVLKQLHPSIGELIPARESPLAHGEGTRWLTYWLGKSGWALVAICRDPGSKTPIHAHPHRLIGKTIEGMVEELRFDDVDGGVKLVDRKTMTHDDLVETKPLETLHLVHAMGDRTVIDLQLRGPEIGEPGRRLRTRAAIELDRLHVGDVIGAEIEVDDRPGHGGEGARVGRPAA